MKKRAKLFLSSRIFESRPNQNETWRQAIPESSGFFFLLGFITRKTAVLGSGSGQRIVRTTCARKRYQSFLGLLVAMFRSDSDDSLIFTPIFSNAKINAFNSIDNINGEKIKIILITKLG